MLALIEERVRFARPRFGSYDVVDFVGVLLGYARPVANADFQRSMSVSSRSPPRSWRSDGARTLAPSLDP